MIVWRYEVAVLLQLASFVSAYDTHGLAQTNNSQSAGSENTTHNNIYDMASYAGLSEHSTMVLVHAVLMVIAWILLLPIGVMFGIAKSHLALPLQIILCVINALGVLFGVLYNFNTPDLYEGNIHHTLGWIATGIMSIHVLISLLLGNVESKRKIGSVGIESEPFLRSSVADIGQQGMPSYSNRLEGSDAAPSDTDSRRSSQEWEKPPSGGRVDNFSATCLSRRPKFQWTQSLVNYFPLRFPSQLPALLSRTLAIFHEIITRTILVFGFVCLLTGGVTYAGIFRGNHIFNGLAHFIKGGIFFGYGLLTLGRWMGSFARYGWAWNVRPSSNVPSAEFVESFVIFLYGSTNVFLEHLAAWGGAWTAQDLEHVSISVMFQGGGLCGMLVESKVIRKWLNTIVGSMPTESQPGTSQNLETRTPPKAYNFSVNPIPALIIFLLGIMMSSHHQSSTVSTKVHKQWGTLLAAFSVMRMLTYTIMYISPPTSVYPSRPPSELVSSFCLISGGIILMASTKDIVHWMEAKNLMAMFLFTVTGGFTAFIMAYEILVLSLKGWATQREIERSRKSVSSEP